jgi:hypothetical protein
MAVFFCFMMYNSAVDTDFTTLFDSASEMYHPWLSGFKFCSMCMPLLNKRIAVENFVLIVLYKGATR